MTEKLCPRCTTVKSVDEFSKDKSASDGLQQVCKACQKKWRDANREIVNAKKRAHYWTDPERFRNENAKFRENNPEWMKGWHEANKEKEQEYQRLYAPRRKELYEAAMADGTLKEYKKEYYEKNKERLQALSAIWRNTHKEQRKEAEEKRRARKLSSWVEDISKIVVFERDGWLCGICLEAVDPAEPWPSNLCATLDHIVAISNGGAHAYANVQLAHFGCNSRKGNRW